MIIFADFVMKVTTRTTPAAFKEAMGRLKNMERVLDNLNEGIIVHDLERRVIYFNRVAEELTGYNREEVLNRDCHEVFGRPFCGPFCKFCDKNESHFLNKITQRTQFITKKGQTLNLEMNLTMILDDDEGFMGVLAAFKDYTEILKLKLKSNTSTITNFCNIIGQNARMIDLFRQIQDIAAYDFPVYIFGETGTGKELVAQAIHDSGSRKSRSFVPINCGALPEGLIESELFGHVRGAFSGAVKDKKGRLELADQGTIFLDEIGELPLNMQTRLLRFLQEGVLERVGSTQSIKVNAHVICATNKDLKAEVFKGNFREDLYYRLNVIPLTLPPLRERKDDIPLLVNHFLQKAAQHYDAPHVPVVNNEAMRAFELYDWPGNVRELQNAIQFAFVKCHGSNVIKLKDLPLEFQNLKAGKGSAAKAQDIEAVKEAPDLSPEAIARALEKTGGNRSKAAKLLGVSRATFYRHLPKQN